MNLDLVLGMSCKNMSCLACDRNTGLVAHSASGVLVLLDTETNRQVKYLHLWKNTVSAANFSPDGKFITTGEIGHRPAVRVWRVKDGQEIATMYGHEFGIKSVIFSPTMEEIVSVGLEHDNEVNVWTWPDKNRVATNKIVDIIRAVAYSSCGSFFVTAGTRHLKFWYPKLTLAESTSCLGAMPLVQPLYGRPGLLGGCKQNTFIDVTCGNGATATNVFSITKAGGLVILNSPERHVTAHKNIKGYKVTCIKVEDRILFIGFDSGDVHMFNALTLIHLAALPVPSFFMKTGLDAGRVFTLTFNPCKTYLTMAYKNSSMCVWDLQDVGNVKQKYVAVYHSKAITNLDVFTTIEPDSQVRETLVTVSYDSTVRLWGIIIGKSICYDRLSILYTDEVPPAVQEAEDLSVDFCGIITVVKVSPDRRQLVTGCKSGNICVYDCETYEHLFTVIGHNREVTCLTFYRNSCGRTVLVSGSRDRLIHVMDADNEFRLTATLNIHSSSITTLLVREITDAVCMISCSSDRTLSLCTSPLPDKYGNRKLPVFQLKQCMTSVSTIADLVMDTEAKHLVLGCQDGNIRVLDMATLQEQRIFRGCTCKEAQIHKICLDKKNILLLSAASDRSINVIHYETGEVIMALSGHTKCVTGLLFTSTGNHVISTSMDGCIFIWRLSTKLIMKYYENKNAMDIRSIMNQSYFTSEGYEHLFVTASGGSIARHSSMELVDLETTDTETEMKNFSTNKCVPNKLLWVRKSNSSCNNCSYKSSYISLIKHPHQISRPASVAAAYVTSKMTSKCGGVRLEEKPPSCKEKPAKKFLETAFNPHLQQEGSLIELSDVASQEALSSEAVSSFMFSTTGHTQPHKARNGKATDTLSPYNVMETSSSYNVHKFWKRRARSMILTQKCNNNN